MTDQNSGMRVVIKRQNAVAIIRYSNPPMGYVSNSGAAAIASAVETCLADDAIGAIVLTGGMDDVFIRHADVGQIERAARALQDGQSDPADWVDAPFPRLTALLDSADKPVIAAINGVCMGGGFEIALACTMRIVGAAVDRIGLPEIRIDLIPGSGGTQRLKRLLGWQRARLFALRGEIVTAQQAVAMGIADEIAPSALDRAIDVANGLAARNRHAVAAILRVTRERDAKAGLDQEIAAFAQILIDDPTIRERLSQFVAAGIGLDALD